jgi:hypothetical protein
MTINQCVLGCGLGRPVEGAVARCLRGKIDNIRCGGGGGGGIAFIFQPGGLNQTFRPVTIAENMTIKRRTTGFGLKWPGHVGAASFFKGDFGLNFWRVGVVTHSSPNVIPSACIRFEAATRPCFLHGV